MIELQTFKKGFKKYGYFESSTEIPIGFWIFDFPKPHGPIRTSFDARKVKADDLDNYLAFENNKIKNSITFYLLDRQILRALKSLRLSPEATGLFHETIRKQLSIEYSPGDFNESLSTMLKLNTEDLLAMSKIFKYKGKKF